MSKSKMKFLFPLLIVLFFIPSSVVAGPTLEETLTFLKNKIESHAGFYDSDEKKENHSFEYRVVYDTCHIRIASVYASIRYGRSKDYIDDSYEVDDFYLSDITEVETKYNGVFFVVILHLSGEKTTYKKYKRNPFDLTHPPKLDYSNNVLEMKINRNTVGIPFKDEKQCDKVGKAFKHAVKLCGGKTEELF